MQSFYYDKKVFMVRYFLIFTLIFFSSAKANNYLSVSGGVFDLFRSKYRSTAICLEYKPSFDLKKMRVISGVMGTFDGSFYFFSGIAIELFFCKNLFFSPNIALGLYLKGNGKDLGCPLEFKSGIELGIQHERHRFSLNFCHISNAHIGNKNPGAEIMLLTYSLSL